MRTWSRNSDKSEYFLHTQLDSRIFWQHNAVFREGRVNASAGILCESIEHQRQPKAWQWALRSVIHFMPIKHSFLLHLQHTPNHFSCKSLIKMQISIVLSYLAFLHTNKQTNKHSDHQRLLCKTLHSRTTVPEKVHWMLHISSHQQSIINEL